MISFPAAYAGRCGNCGEPFQAGAEVFYDDQDSLLVVECCGEEGQGAVHGAEQQTVKVDQVMPRGKTARDRCDRCFQVPASNGVCGCS